MDVARRRLLGERRVLSRHHVPKLRAGGVDLQLCMVGGDFPLFSGDHGGVDHLREALSLVAALLAELDEDAEANESNVFCVRTAADVDAASIERIGFVLHTEGAGLFGGSLELVRVFFELGLRSIGLAWNGSNHAADGYACDRARGLSDFGAALIEEAQRLGMLIDVSHLSDAGVDDVLALSAYPVIASHSNPRGVLDHPRNLRDEHLRGIAESGGTIGLCAYPPLVAPSHATVDDLLVHLDYLCEAVGVEHVAFGGDFIDFLDDVWYDSAPIRPYQEEVRRPFPKGLTTVADLPNLIDAMTRAGYRDEDVEAIMGGNLRRVLKRVLPGGS